MRRPAARRASPMISSAGNAANCGRPVGIFRPTVIAAEEIALENLVADAVSVEETRDRAIPRVTSVCAMPSISATSVPGRIGCQTASTSAGRSSRSGPIRWNSAPRRRAARSRARAMCSLVPPPPTSLFFSAMPPKASTRRCARPARPS